MVAIPGQAMSHHWARTPTLPVNEVFGPTIQGEGPHTGRRCWFVRLGMCNLHCTWCDTKRTWDRDQYDLDAENPPDTLANIHHRLDGLGCPTGGMVVLTGGEPLIHTHMLDRLIDYKNTGHPWRRWHIESNGTIPPPDWLWWHRVEAVSISPKIGEQGDPERRRLKPRSLMRWADLTRSQPGLVAWKFVITSDHDVDAVRALVSAYEVPAEAVWLMPEGERADQLLYRGRAVRDHAVREGWNMTTRLHVLTGAR